MDFKGITWAGDIYQKFEDMCLEVEEVMYEDTVKYVENQVQKVGANVKKFYAEVMLDLLPPSCVDPMKVAAGDLPPKPYAQTDINSKPKPSILDIHGMHKKKETEDEDISDLTTEESSLSGHDDANHLSPLPSRLLVENTRSDMCFRKSKKVGVYKRPIGIKRISKNNLPPKISRAMASLSGDKSSLLVCEMRSNCLVASDVRRDPGETVTQNTPISHASFESFNFDQILSAESVREGKNNSESTLLASDQILSAESVRQENNDSESASLASDNLSAESLRQKKDDVESVGQYVMTSYEDKFREDGSHSQIKSNVGADACQVELGGKEVIVSYEDNFDIEVVETEDVLEPRVEIFEPVGKSKLEESCILVEGDELHFLSQGTKKHKSYKKKIREAISSKLRSTRRQDQCVFHYKDLCEKNDGGVVIPAITMDYDKRKLPTHDSCESDWELL